MLPHVLFVYTQLFTFRLRQFGSKAVRMRRQFVVLRVTDVLKLKITKRKIRNSFYDIFH